MGNLDITVRQAENKLKTQFVDIFCRAEKMHLLSFVTLFAAVALSWTVLQLPSFSEQRDARAFAEQDMMLPDYGTDSLKSGSTGAYNTLQSILSDFDFNGEDYS